jgi:ubiquitin C-terminal hydrolase
VDIHSSVHLARTTNRSDSTGDDPVAKVQLEDCLQSFTSWENLDQKEMFHCKRCKQLQPADKKLDIWKLPPCLVSEYHCLTSEFWRRKVDRELMICFAV